MISADKLREITKESEDRINKVREEAKRESIASFEKDFEYIIVKLEENILDQANRGLYSYKMPKVMTSDPRFNSWFSVFCAENKFTAYVDGDFHIRWEK